jgi:hypothetical protein
LLLAAASFAWSQVSTTQVPAMGIDTAAVDPAAQLPSAPTPQDAFSAFANPGVLFHAMGVGIGIGQEPANSVPAGGEQQDPPIVTMAPHSEDGIYWISGQANIIFQGRLPFHSLYQGKNSFRNSAEYKTSMVGTLYTALRRNRSIRYNTDFIFDLEAAEGRGLSEAFGLAGFTNLDVVRNPNLGRVPYPARYGIHQVIGLTSKTTSQEAGFFAVAPSVPLRRFA